MLKRFQIIHQTGQFESFDGTHLADLARLTLVYADNGRGKTTLAAILRSVAEQDAESLLERRRLPISGKQKVVLEFADSSVSIFEKNKWSGQSPPVYIFDDHFVDRNVHSGLSVDSSHGQNLHEIVLGNTGVILANQMTTLANEITRLGKEIKVAKAGVERHIVNESVSADDFVILGTRPNIADLIIEQERQIAAFASSSEVVRAQLFAAISMSKIDLTAFTKLLATTLDTIDHDATEAVNEHFSKIGADSEGWVKSGIDRCKSGDSSTEQACPFCAQPLSRSSIFLHYKSYFSEIYRKHLDLLKSGIAGLEIKLGSAMVLALQTAAHAESTKRAFWARYLTINAPDIDINKIVSSTQTLYREMKRLLDKKLSAPLDAVQVDEPLLTAHQTYTTACSTATATCTLLMEFNQAISRVKQIAVSTPLSTLQLTLSKLNSEQARCTAQACVDCIEYSRLLNDKLTRERAKEKARSNLDLHRSKVFPSYSSKTNSILKSFNAGYSVELESSNPSGRPSSRLILTINSASMPAVTPSRHVAEPCFKSSLSAGDRTTLALAFFFAYVNAEQKLSNSIIVLDDPVSSLDDFRTSTTIDQIKSLLDTAAQVVVLSHSKSFLCEIWDRLVKKPRGNSRTPAVSLHIPRVGGNSTIQPWNILDLWFTEHDRRAELFGSFLANGATADLKKVAEALRPHLEYYCRSSFPEHFKPDEQLGPCIAKLQGDIGKATEIVSQSVCDQLKRLTDYSNQFHHDGNPDWKYSSPREQELVGYVKQLLQLLRR